MPLPERTDPAQAVNLLREYRARKISRTELTVRLSTECNFPADLIDNIIRDADKANEKPPPA
jgi:hypothetical protein